MAQDLKKENIKIESVNPDSFYYKFKRLWEKVQGKLAFSDESKINFQEKILDVRFSELYYVVKNKKLADFQTTTERFSYQAGILTEELMEKNKTTDKEKLIKEFELLSRFLEKLRDEYSANSSYWMLIQHNINTLKILSERLK